MTHRRRSERRARAASLENVASNEYHNTQGEPSCERMARFLFLLFFFKADDENANIGGGWMSSGRVCFKSRLCRGGHTGGRNDKGPGSAAGNNGQRSGAEAGERTASRQTDRRTPQVPAPLIHLMSSHLFEMGGQISSPNRAARRAAAARWLSRSLALPRQHVGELVGLPGGPLSPCSGYTLFI